MPLLVLVDKLSRIDYSVIDWLIEQMNGPWPEIRNQIISALVIPGGFDPTPESKVVHIGVLEDKRVAASVYSGQTNF